MSGMYVENFSKIESIMQECVLQSGRETLPPECLIGLCLFKKVALLQELKTSLSPPREHDVDGDTEQEMLLKREIEELKKVVLAYRSTVPEDLAKLMRANVANAFNKSKADAEGAVGEDVVGSKELQERVKSLKEVPWCREAAPEQSTTLKLQTSIAEHKAALDELLKVKSLWQADASSADTGLLPFDRPLVANTPILEKDPAPEGGIPSEEKIAYDSGLL